MTLVDNQDSGDNWTNYLGDCVSVARALPDASVGFGVYSPPFANLYTYSDSMLDMGNCANDAEFFDHYRWLIAEQFRILKPGRLVAVHCKDLVQYKSSSGMAGLRDFSGEIIREHQAAGFAFHSRVTIWKCPVTEMQRTKAHGLLWKQLRRDSTFSRHGLADYVLLFRKWAKEGEPVEPVTHTMDSFPVDQWQKWASPVWSSDAKPGDAPTGLEALPIWMDIDQTDVLNVAAARVDKDEKHLCPLQLDLIERCIVLWSNPGDVVWSPFSGIGSEGYKALQLGRKFVGSELKESYWRQACANLRRAVSDATAQGSLF